MIFESDTRSMSWEISLESFSAAKDYISKMKRQATEWEKAIANHVFDKRPIKIYKEFVQFNNLKK